VSWSIGISTGGCPERPIVEVLEALQRSGTRGVELGTPPRHFDPGQRAQVAAVGAKLSALGLTAVSIHAPFGATLDLAHANEHHRRAAVDAILKSASALKRLGGRIVVLHPSDLPRHGADVDARLADCAVSLRTLTVSCRDEGMTLAIESPLPHLIGGHPDEYAWILRHVDASARACLDTGHIALGGQWRRFVEISDGRLAHVHASDNHGQRDDHLPPGEGTIDWPEIAASLRGIGFAGWMMLEVHCPGSDLAHYFEQARTRAEALLER